MNAILTLPGRVARRTFALAVGTLLAATPALDAQVTIPAPQQSVPIAIRGATIHTVANGVIENGTIVFEDGVITAVGADVDIPANAQTVDATGKHVYPGLIDAYSQVGITEIGSVDVTSDTREMGDFNPNAQPNVAVNPESRHIGTTRSNGILVSLVTPSGGLIPGVSSAMNMEGWTWEEMTMEAAAALNVNWPNAGGGGGFGGFGGGGGNNDRPTYEDQIRELREYFAQARAYRDAKEAGGFVPTDIRLEAMIPAVNGEVPVIVSADDAQQIQDAIRWAEDEGVRLVIRGGEGAIQVAEHLAQKQIPVILTSVIGGPNRSHEPYDQSYSRPARLHAAGVQFAIAGDASAAYANRMPYDAGAAVAFGLPEDEAIKAVTMNPAVFLGIDGKVGSLEPGKDATLLITTGSPLDYLADIEQAYIVGREIDMTDIHRFFFEKYMEKLRQLQPWISN